MTKTNTHDTSFISHLDELDLRKGLMLDTGTTASVTQNESFLNTITPVSRPVPVGTNGGMISITKTANLNDLPNLPAWCLSLIHI